MLSKLYSFRVYEAMNLKFLLGQAIFLCACYLVCVHIDGCHLLNKVEIHCPHLYASNVLLQLLRPIYKQIAENQNAEIFSANTLLVILGTSLLTARVGQYLHYHTHSLPIFLVK